ncbi:flagellar biosynthetic protein FliO, partial [bacterium]|nr:flagellar biosynthetic protein FliO [bacterium]
ARALGSLAAVVALIAALALLLRRLRENAPARGTSRSLRAIERLDLGGKRELRVVRAGERTLVLGVTEQRIELLTELETATETAGDGAPEAPATSALATGSGTPVLRVLRKLATSG